MQRCQIVLADGEVITQIPQDFPPVRCDRHALLQVLLNLAQNALRAVSAQPRRQLTLSARLEGGRAVLSVRDSGPGIAEPEHLFQPFRTGADGSGLGLYISRRLAQLLGGRIELESVPGNGSTFTLVVPL